MYDLIIVGSGPAGLSAAIYAQRAMKNTLVIEASGISGGQVLSTYEVDNYPGLPGISGLDLGTKMKEHADKLGAVFTEAEVNSITPEGDAVKVRCDDGEYLTKGVILATGATHSHLNVPGEEELCGMGVSYCATCDGAFFAGKTVAVVGGGDVAVEDAIFLSRACSKVYLIHRRDELRATKVLQDVMFKTDNIEVIWNTTVESINGDDSVQSVTLKNKISNETSNLWLDGVFVAVGITPASAKFIPEVAADENGYIIAGEDCRTNIPFVYAAGDVRKKPLRQIITAAADGANAVTSFLADTM